MSRREQGGDGWSVSSITAEQADVDTDSTNARRSTAAFFKACIQAISQASDRDDGNVRGVIHYRMPVERDTDWLPDDVVAAIEEAVDASDTVDKRISQIAIVIEGVNPERFDGPKQQQPQDRDLASSPMLMAAMLMGRSEPAGQHHAISTGHKRIVDIQLATMHDCSEGDTASWDALLAAREAAYLQAFNLRALGIAIVEMGFVMCEPEFVALGKAVALGTAVLPAKAAQDIVRRAHALVITRTAGIGLNADSDPVVDDGTGSAAAAAAAETVTETMGEEMWDEMRLSAADFAAVLKAAPDLIPGGHRGSGGGKLANALRTDSKEGLDQHEIALLPAFVSRTATKTSFSDVANLDYAKDKLKDLIMLPILRPELFARGVLSSGCKGVLLFGPPGTGKTLLAKAVASEAGANFLHITQGARANQILARPARPPARPP